VDDSVPSAIVAAGEQRRDLHDGASLTVGRRSSCDIWIGHASQGPEDDGVSRHAATITSVSDRISILNESRTRPIAVKVHGGAAYLVNPGHLVSLVDRRFELVFEGRVHTYRLSVTRLGPADESPMRTPTTTAGPTIDELDLTDRERRVLAAVCEPLLTGLGGEPATYREAGRRLGLTPHSVRNVLDGIRNRAVLLGIPGMEGPSGKEAIARFAVWSGIVTAHDIKQALPPIGVVGEP